MKKINKFIISISSTMPILLFATAISCKKYEESINEKQKQIETKLLEIEKLESELKTDKLENEISTKLLKDLKAKAKSDKIFKSLDEKTFKSIMSELDNIPKIAKEIAKEFKKLTSKKEKILERSKLIINSDFQKASKYVVTTSENTIKEVINKCNTLLKDLEKENKSDKDFRELLGKINNLIDEKKYFESTNNLITKLLFLQNQYSKKEKAENLLKSEEKTKFLNDILEIKNFISNVSDNFSERDFIQKVQNYINKFQSYYDKLTKFIQFSAIANLFEKLEKVIDDKEGLLNDTLLKKLFTEDNLITNIKKEINDFIQECGNLLKKEFSEEINIKTKEVNEILTKAGGLFAKYFKEILNKVKEQVLKNISENDFELAKKQFLEDKNKFLDLFEKDKKYYLGKQNYKLFNFENTILAEYYNLIKDIMQISTISIKEGEKVVSSGAEIFKVDEKKLTFVFKLVNKLLSTDEQKTEIFNSTISIDVNKK